VSVDPHEGASGALLELLRGETDPRAFVQNFEAELDNWTLMSFWYKLSFDDLVHMPAAIRERYASRLIGYIADYQQMLITASAFPHMTDAGRSGVSRSIDQMRGVIERSVQSTTKNVQSREKAGETTPAVPPPTDQPIPRSQYLANLTSMGVRIIQEPPKAKIV
jgi:hypothetical protein